MEKEKTRVQKTSAKYQYLFACVVNLLTLTYGLSCGWPSPSLFLLQSEESPLLSGKITTDQSSWVASFLCIGGLFGNLILTHVTSRFGRKNPLLFIALPAIIGWILILFAQNVYYLYLARLLNGFVAGGIFATVPQYLAEVSSDHVRGVLGSTLVLSVNIGILLAFIFGHFFQFYVTPLIAIAVTIIFFVALFFFPESPIVLMKQNKISETEESIRFYQSISNSSSDNRLLSQELNKLQCAISKSNDEQTTENENTSLNWADLTTRPGSKAMIIGIVLIFLNQFCGIFAILSYTANIFKEAGSAMHPNISAIVIGIIQLIGSYVATILVDRAGRKFLFAVSTIGCALGLSVHGVYMMLKSWDYDVDTFNWIPLVSFSFSIFISSWAILTLPFLVISEVMPDKLKGFGTLSLMTLFWLSQFVMVKFLPLLNASLGFHNSVFLFAGICVSCCVFIMLCMPETKGRSYEQIMSSLQ